MLSECTWFLIARATVESWIHVHVSAGYWKGIVTSVLDDEMKRLQYAVQTEQTCTDQKLLEITSSGIAQALFDSNDAGAPGNIWKGFSSAGRRKSTLRK